MINLKFIFGFIVGFLEINWKFTFGLIIVFMKDIGFVFALFIIDFQYMYSLAF